MALGDAWQRLSDTHTQTRVQIVSHAWANPMRDAVGLHGNGVAHDTGESPAGKMGMAPTGRSTDFPTILTSLEALWFWTVGCMRMVSNAM